MSRISVPWTVAVGSAMASATAFRVGVSWLELGARHTPSLTRLALHAVIGGPEGATAEATFRDDLLALGRESADASLREVSRGLDDLDRLTRSDKEQPGARPHRPYRVKL